VAGGYYEEGKGLKQLGDEMVDNITSGVTAVKMKIGGVSINEDVERVNTARSAIGPDIKLLVDANCAYQYHEAIDIARKIENQDIFWFEEPLPPDDYDGYPLRKDYPRLGRKERGDFPVIDRHIQKKKRLE